MRIDQLIRPLEAYLNSRSAILMVLEDRALSVSELIDILRANPSVVFQRRRNPAHWQPLELEQLALEFKLSTDGIVGLRVATERINSLPPFIQTQLLKESLLHRGPFRVRCHDYNYWKYAELEQMAGTLRRWQNSRKLDTLLADRRYTAALVLQLN